MPEPSNAVLLEKIENILHRMDGMEKSISSKADKWVELGAKGILTTVILYLVGGLLGLFKIVPVSTALSYIYLALVA